MTRVGVIDAGIGNIGSVTNMVRRVGGEVAKVHRAADAGLCDCLILPGVGSFDAGMRQLRERGLDRLIQDRVARGKTPLLGICLGMQLLLESSEEGEEEGLALIPGRVVRFDFSGLEREPKIPHMGWNQLATVADSALFAGLGPESRFYFVHSYHANCSSRHVLATSRYGYEFPCAVADGLLFGVQFHPEKSHSFGMRLMRNFLEM